MMRMCLGAPNLYQPALLYGSLDEALVAPTSDSMRRSHTGTHASSLILGIIVNLILALESCRPAF